MLPQSDSNRESGVSNLVQGWSSDISRTGMKLECYERLESTSIGVLFHHPDGRAVYHEAEIVSWTQHEQKSWRYGVQFSQPLLSRATD